MTQPNLARPQVLVLLASYNGALWISEQVESILSQEEVVVQLLIRDDKSSDGTPVLVSQRFGLDTRVSVVAATSSSGSAGGNFRELFRSVSGRAFDYVALADQDDIWQPRKLISAVEALRANGASGYSGAVRSFWPGGRQLYLRQNGNVRAADYLFEGAGQGCTFVLDRTLFLRVRQFCIDHPLFVERLHYHDWLIYLLARAWQFDWFFDERALMLYRQHGGNEIGSRGSFKASWRRIKLIRSGWYRSEIDKAIDLLQMISLRSSIVANFAERFRLPDSFARRAFLFFFFLFHGRRRRGDRIVMAFSAALGWL